MSLHYTMKTSHIQSIFALSRNVRLSLRKRHSIFFWIIHKNWMEKWLAMQPEWRKRTQNPSLVNKILLCKRNDISFHYTTKQSHTYIYIYNLYGYIFIGGKKPYVRVAEWHTMHKWMCNAIDLIVAIYHHALLVICADEAEVAAVAFHNISLLHFCLL